MMNTLNARQQHVDAGLGAGTGGVDAKAEADRDDHRDDRAGRGQSVRVAPEFQAWREGGTVNCK